MKQKLDKKKAVEFIGSRKNIALFQILTSDVKKNWSEGKWLEFFKYWIEYQPNIRNVLLGAPSEQSQLEQIKTKLEKIGITVEVFICDFQTALSLMQKARLLVTGDTAIKHLAMATQIKVVELSLGSSQPLQTGAYTNGSLIVQPITECGPCRHSDPCTMQSHLCGSKVVGCDFAALVNRYLNQDFAGLNRIQENSVKSLRIYVAKNQIDEDWQLKSLGQFIKTQSFQKRTSNLDSTL